MTSEDKTHVGKQRSRILRFGPLVIAILLLVLVVGWVANPWLQKRQAEARRHSEIRHLLEVGLIEGSGEQITAALEMGFDINATLVAGQPALVFVAGKGSFETAEFLLANGADVNGKDERGMTPLMYTVMSGRTNRKDMVALLLSYGADVNVKDSWGGTALSWAKVHAANDPDIAALLMEHGAVDDGE